ncbi:Endonuclease/exonuclease/phosphatase [Xylaria digitata]|nr:Endonuclease/exonuclease/phosphatase [Xylaria digitata]
MSNDDEKAPSLDVFILTFNAGKARINPSIFALHLRNAFAQNATDLPELVVICLQEMAPLEHSFIGSYMINPYFQSWVSAVNLAASPPDDRPRRNQEASRLGSSDGSEDGSEDRYLDEIRDVPYTLMTTRHAGMTGILLFSRDPSALDNLKSSEVGFGAGAMGNKGAVGLRMLFSKKDAKGRKRQTELTFVGAHLAAHEWNLEKRNKNWESIVSGLLFEDPRQFYDGESTLPTAPISGNGDESQALLSQSPNEKKLHDITIFKPGSHLFVAGDLNYRISKTSPTPHSVFPLLDPKSPNFYGRYLALDQLALEKAAGRTLHGLSEAPIAFPPTYKLDYEIEGKSEAEAQAHRNGYPRAHDAVAWKWAPHRWPGWCDRVLYLDTPSSIGLGMAINTIAYDTLPPVRTSDHRAVFLRLSVPVVEPSILVPSPDFCASNSDDPRVKLPYPVDFESWEQRARVKKWERVIGWSMLLSHSKQGIAIFMMLFFVGIVAWWLRSR